MKKVFTILTMAFFATFAKGQTLPMTVVSAEIPNYSTNSFFQEINGDLLYVTDTLQMQGTNFVWVLSVMKVNPNTNALEPFFAIPNKKGFFNNKLQFNSATGNYIVNTYDGSFKNFIYAGTSNNMQFMDSIFVAPIGVRSYPVANKQFMVGKDSVFSMSYTPNDISFQYAETGNRSIIFSGTSENELILGIKTDGLQDVYELVKYNNGNLIIIDTAHGNSLYAGSIFKNGTDAFIPFHGKVFKIDATNLVTTYNFPVQNVIAKLGNSIIGTEGSKLKSFNLTTNTETILSPTIMNEYYLLDKVVYNNNICYIEGSYQNNDLVVITDGTFAGTKSKRLKKYLGTQAKAWALCGDNLVLDYNDNDVYYEVAIIKPDTSIAIYDQKPGNLAGISPNEAHNANGTSYLVYQNSVGGYTLSKIDQCNVATSITENYLLQDDVKMYPNPANNLLHIESKDPINHLSIVDISGKVIFDKKIENQYKISLNLSLHKGIYFVKTINNNEFIKTEKLIIE